MQKLKVTRRCSQRKHGITAENAEWLKRREILLGAAMMQSRVAGN
jgi:hypothetical protein